LKDACKLYGVRINFQAFLARGLSYYNGSVFEVKGDAKESIAAGGSYSVNGMQATGISFGLDRLEVLTKVAPLFKKVLVISLDQDKKAVGICGSVRELGIPCEIYYGRPGKALDYANSLKIPLVVFVGEEEVKKKKFKIKNMNSGKERLVSEGGLLKELKRLN